MERNHHTENFIYDVAVGVISEGLSGLGSVERVLIGEKIVAFHAVEFCEECDTAYDVYGSFLIDRQKPMIRLVRNG